MAVRSHRLALLAALAGVLLQASAARTGGVHDVYLAPSASVEVSRFSLGSDAAP